MIPRCLFKLLFYEFIPKLKIAPLNPVFQIINCAPDNRSNFEKLGEIDKNGFWDSLYNKEFKILISSLFIYGNYIVHSIMLVAINPSAMFKNTCVLKIQV